MREPKNPLTGWGVDPAIYEPAAAGDVVMQWRSIGSDRVPYRFGGYWRHAEAVEGEPVGRLTGREVELWLHVDEAGRVEVERVTFVGFDLDYREAPVVAMRDTLVEMFSRLDDRGLERLGAAHRSMTQAERTRLRGEVRRRRRSNKVDLERVAELYRQGGAQAVQEGYYEDDYEPAESTVFRWVKAAREASVLEPRESEA